MRLRIAGVYSEAEKERLESLAKENLQRFKSLDSSKISLSQELHEYAMNSLLNMFKSSTEHSFIGAFNPEKQEVELYKRFSQLFNEGYVFPALPLTVGGIRHTHIDRETKQATVVDIAFKPRSGTTWIYERILELDKEIKEQGKIMIRFHTQPIIFPSPNDMVFSYVVGIVGFKNPNETLEKLFIDSFSSLRERRANSKPNSQGYTEIPPYDVDKNLWTQICKECIPTVALYYGNAGEEPNEISQLYY